VWLQAALIAMNTANAGAGSFHGPRQTATFEFFGSGETLINQVPAVSQSPIIQSPIIQRPTIESHSRCRRTNKNGDGFK
jgi:hypothetical protein